MTSDFKRFFYPKFYPLHLFSHLNSWERASIFPFECSVLNKGTTGTIFMTSLVWRGPWLGIEPGTSRTRSQHYTTRLLRRRYYYEIWKHSQQHSAQLLIYRVHETGHTRCWGWIMLVDITLIFSHIKSNISDIGFPQNKYKMYHP